MYIFVDIYSIIYIYYIKHNAMTWMRLRPPICWMTSLKEKNNLIPTSSLKFSQAIRTLIPKRPLNVKKVTISKNHSNYHTQNIFSVENIIFGPMLD